MLSHIEQWLGARHGADLEEWVAEARELGLEAAATDVVAEWEALGGEGGGQEAAARAEAAPMVEAVEAFVAATAAAAAAEAAAAAAAAEGRGAHC